ncbi:MAG: ABC transporter ATP-binding protein [Cyanobacteria bacterium P01_F01_bin.53]
MPPFDTSLPLKSDGQSDGQSDDPSDGRASGKPPAKKMSAVPVVHPSAASSQPLEKTQPSKTNPSGALSGALPSKVLFPAAAAQPKPKQVEAGRVVGQPVNGSVSDAEIFLDPSPTAEPVSCALEARGLRKHYGRGKKRFEAVRNVSLTLENGEVLSFLGPNGAGKTTTIKMISGLVRPDMGWVHIAGLDPHRQPQALRGVGAVLEGNRNLYWRLTPLENLEYFGVLRQMTPKAARQRGEQLLAEFGLSDKRKVPVRKLSRGMQQKVAIAVALIHEPTLLLLDEPTLGLDVEAGETVKGLIRQVAASGCAILLTTHQLHVAEELSDRVAVIRQGEIVAEQTTQALIQQFSKRTDYHIEFEGVLSASAMAAIQALGATIEGQHIHYHPSAQSFPSAFSLRQARSDQPNLESSAAVMLYELLGLIYPLPLVEVRQDRADLTDVFLQLVKDV